MKISKMVLCAIMALVLMMMTAGLSGASAQSKLEVFYIGGWDCPPCIGWKNNEKPAWVASPEFKQVEWIEIDPPHLREAYDERYWPLQHRSIRDQLPLKSGTPRFLIVRNGKVIANRFRGGDYWSGTFADIKRLLAER